MGDGCEDCQFFDVCEGYVSFEICVFVQFVVIFEFVVNGVEDSKVGGLVVVGVVYFYVGVIFWDDFEEIVVGVVQLVYVWDVECFEFELVQEFVVCDCEVVVGIVIYVCIEECEIVIGVVIGVVDVCYICDGSMCGQEVEFGGIEIEFIGFGFVEIMV